MEADEVSIREQNFHSQVREYTVRAVTLGPSPSQPFTGAAFLAAALPSGPALSGAARGSGCGPGCSVPGPALGIPLLWVPSCASSKAGQCGV